MAIPLGLEAELFYWNPGTADTPRAVWPATGTVDEASAENVFGTGATGLVRLACINDITVNLSKGEADITTRKGAGWRQRKATLKDGEISFTMLWDQDDPGVQTLINLWLSGGRLGLAALDVDPFEPGLGNTPKPTGTKFNGIWADYEVFDFEKTEGLEDAQSASVTMKITDGALAPQWVANTL